MMSSKATQTKKVSKIKYNHIIDMPLLIIVLILLALGIVMVLSASAPSALAKYGDSYKHVKAQGFAAVIGIIIMIVSANIPYQKYSKIYKPLQ